MRLVIAHGDPRKRAGLARLLDEEGHDVLALATGADVIALVRTEPPDLVVLATVLPDMEGIEVVGDLRMMDEARVIPLVLVADEATDEIGVVQGLLAGADDFVSPITRSAELVARIRVQLRNKRDREMLARAQTERLALLDAARTCSLTGLANRRAVDEALAAGFESSRSALLLIADVDHFKTVNDTWGHAVGDEVLRALAKTLKRLARGDDLVGRYGGEEFVAIIRDAPPERHAAIAERFVRGVREARLPEGLGPTSITVSIGWASWDGTRPVPHMALFFATADRGLYAAKRAGRDCAVRGEPPQENQPETTGLARRPISQRASVLPEGDRNTRRASAGGLR